MEITREKMIAHVDVTCELAMKNLEDHGQLVMVCFINQGGRVEIVGCPECPDDFTKNQFFDAMAYAATTFQADYVIMLADAWCAWKEEGETDEEFEARFKQAQAHGVRVDLRRRECITLTAMSYGGKLGTYSVIQSYERKGDEIIWGERKTHNHETSFKAFDAYQKGLAA